MSMPRPDPRLITYDPPADGAYPPRLLTPDGVIWLPAGRDVVILPDEVHVWHADGVCRIDRLPTASPREILLNGAPLVVEHILQDGDFYWDGQDRFVFQADPVADRKRALADESFDPLSIPAQVAAKLRFDAAGITGGREDVTLPWMEITRLQIQSLAIFTKQIRVWTDSDRPALRVKLRPRQLKQAIAWLDLALPFDLTVTLEEKTATVLSPYAVAVQTKVLIPAAEGRRVLPAEEAVLLAHPSRSPLFACLIFLGIAITVGTLFFATLDPAYLIVGPLAISLYGLGLLAIFAVIRWFRPNFR